MGAPSVLLLTPKDLAKRWARSETAVRLMAAVGVGPSFTKVNGTLLFPLNSIQKYEQAYLFTHPAAAV